MLVVFWSIIARFMKMVKAALEVASGLGPLQKAGRGDAAKLPGMHGPGEATMESGGQHTAAWGGGAKGTGRTKDNAVNFGELIQDLVKRVSDGRKGSMSWEDVRASVNNAPIGEQFDKLRKWLDEPVVGEGNGSRKPYRGHDSKRQSAPQAAPQSTRQPAPRAETRRERPRRTKVVYKATPNNPVQSNRRLPKQGRSSLLSGLLSGPWG